MDRAENLLPPGVPGELYIGGQGVSPGYVARPELTAERFVPDRFGTEPNRTLFRTGDLVRIIHGNQLEFLGRLDHQVKLRGYRIELGEIESVLRGHDAITDAVAILREDIPGEPRLVAYVLARNGTIDAAAVLEYMAALLPEYMLPTTIVAVESFPLSTSGKVDRRSLPAPESIESHMVPVNPTPEGRGDEVELKLLTIFRETLRKASLGVTDNFFRYGGYSLLAIRLFSRIDRELHMRLPISLLFDAPTVRELARVIRRGVRPSTIVPIRPYGRLAPVFLIQSYLLYNAMLEMVEADRPVYGVREMGDEREPLSIAERARQFAGEIVAVQPEGPFYLAGWCAAATLTVEIARQLREAGHPVGLVALFDAERPGFALPGGLKATSERILRKSVFHWSRLRRLSWRERAAFLGDMARRNWDLAEDMYYMASYHLLSWLQSRVGLPVSANTFYRAQANMIAGKDLSLRPYPGKLNLYRAAEAPDYAEVDATLGWSAVARGGVTVDFVAGDHTSMFKKPYVDSLARRLQAEMQRCEAAGAHG
jgi:thioesterase domain-containing protein